jgi:hypothetical protein
MSCNASAMKEPASSKSSERSDSARSRSEPASVPRKSAPPIEMPPPSFIALATVPDTSAKKRMRDM